MPGVQCPTPYLNPENFKITKLIQDNISTIRSEYFALKEHFSDSPSGFRSLTSMNYDSGWSTLPLHQNGHRLPNFPYHLCPETLNILETLPIAGRISGFNKQKVKTGIPEHSDGNNMWLTLQCPIELEVSKSFIVNGGEKVFYEKEKCVIYDTTYSHYTFNESEKEERVVLHVDFWNFEAMCEQEIEVMRYVYEMKEKFEVAERG